MVIVFSVAMSTLRPWRPMPELRLVDSSAPAMSMPRAPTAWSTVVAVVQIVCGSPSTVKVTSRPNRTATCVPSSSLVSTPGATRSRLPTSMPSRSSRAPTVPAVVLSSCDLPVQ